MVPVRVESAPRPAAVATRIGRDNIEVDGVLDEDAWRDAEPITRFIQSTPNTGYPATEPTDVRIVYDDDRIYIGAELRDSDPDRITAQYLEQDFETHNDDVFAVTLDTFLDRRNSFMFLINPRGAIKDGQTFDNSRNINLAWEGVADLKTRIHDRGWTVELAIPFSTLRFDPDRDDQSWGLQILRRIRRKNEDVYWAPVDRRTRIHKMERAGTLHGLRGLPRTRNLWIKPYGLAATTSGERFPGAGGPEYDGGLDLKWGITSRLTLDLTWRTDFSQVEVDQEQVNLTRFSLFFPEKRDFFMENSGIFEFGDQTEREYRMGASSRDFSLFHSRRIGLHEGTPVPIVGGGRVTGRVGPWEIGVLEMRTRDALGLPEENFAVARVRRSLGPLQVGGIFASRDATVAGEGPWGDHNRSYGVDANLRAWTNLVVHSYWARSEYPAAEGDVEAAKLGVAWRDALWNVSAFRREIGDAFDPGIGFIRRQGIRHSYGTVGIHPRPSIPFVTEVNPYVELHYITDLSDVLETREAVGGVDVAFDDGGRVAAQVTDRFERLDEPFGVLAEAVVPAGEYEFVEGSVEYRSSAGRPVSGTARVSGGHFFGGSRRSLGLSAAWRPSHHLSLHLSAQHNEIDLEGEHFTADVYGSRVNVAFSTRFFTDAFVQYNEATDELVSNVRMNFIHAPLSDVFLVWTERRNVESGVLQDRRLTIKVTRLMSF